ncbi:MAG TPA: hypothetical protein VD905_09155 [Flavobacteriales bacterium]|nr:hypothetical protein [Flavobacteriales bacterium]
MAGNKETPRQRMIGMMYLVLTALLALNVSKEIVNAFIRLNDKMEDANIVLQSKINQDYERFKMAMAVKNTRTVAEQWDEKANIIRKSVSTEIDYLLGETNSLLKETEGSTSEWLTVDKRTGAKKLKNLMNVQAKDDYDAATRLFVGGDPTAPIQRGQDIRNRLQKLRNKICVTLAGYTKGNTVYKFDPASLKNYDPKNKSAKKMLANAMKTVNPEDTAVVSRVFRTLSYPLNLTEYDETTSWQGALFDHAPVVAAAAILTSLRSDVKNAESLALDHLVGKIDDIIMPINKIEPVAFAPKGYLNVGDTMPLRVMIAAYDSNDVCRVQYAENDPEMKTSTETKGTITLRANTPGIKNIFGTIAVKEHGELKWKPWTFTYEVGQPLATVSATELNVLFVGYPNKIKATASGYASNDITLKGDGLIITKDGDGYLVKAPANQMGRKVKLSVFAKGKIVGTQDFRVRAVPRPTTYFGSITSTDSRITRQQLIGALPVGLRLAYDESALISAPFVVRSYNIVINVRGNERTLHCSGPYISAADQQTLRTLQSGSTITIKDIQGTCYGSQVRSAPIVATIQ